LMNPFVVSHAPVLHVAVGSGQVGSVGSQVTTCCKW
jgi:hypothetical protein